MQLQSINEIECSSVQSITAAANLCLMLRVAVKGRTSCEPERTALQAVMASCMYYLPLGKDYLRVCEFHKLQTIAPPKVLMILVGIQCSISGRYWFLFDLSCLGY